MVSSLSASFIFYLFISYEWVKGRPAGGPKTPGTQWGMQNVALPDLVMCQLNFLLGKEEEGRARASEEEGQKKGKCIADTIVRHFPLHFLFRSVPLFSKEQWRRIRGER